MIHTHITLLQQMPVLSGLKPETLQFVLDESELVQVPAGDYFFQEGEIGESLFVLETGSVSIVKNWKSEPVIVGHLASGDFFGEMALIDLRPRSASVKAVETCLAIAIPRQALLSLLERDVQQFSMIMINMGREVSRRLRLVNEQMFVLQQKHQHEIESLQDEDTAHALLLSSAFG